MYTAEREEELLGGGPCFVLDAIDNIDTKASNFYFSALLCCCVPLPACRSPCALPSCCHACSMCIAMLDRSTW